MTLYRELPDLEAACSITLRNAAIPDLTGVYSSIPAKNPQWPLVVIRRLGGVPVVRQYLDMARIQIDVWGGAKGDGPNQPKKSQLADIAQKSRVALLEMEGTSIYEPVDVFISAVNDASGLYWLPDPHTGRERYMFALWVYGRTIEPQDDTENVGMLLVYGDDFHMPIAWSTDNVLNDLTTYTGELVIHDVGNTILYQTPVATATFTENGDDYNVSVDIPFEDIATFDFNSARWYVEVTPPLGTPRRLVQGGVTVGTETP